jgi:branched-chain amino acid transport system substrate-binding protein
MKTFIASLALAATGVLATGGAAAETLRIGVVGSLSGPGTAWGTAILGAAQLAAQDVNAKGGLDVAGKKYTIDVVAYDDKYKAGDSLTAMNRLIFDDKINIVMGPTGTAPALAVIPLAGDNKVITMTMAWGDKVLSPNLKYSFRPVVPAQVFAAPQIRWVVQKLGVKRVGALFPNDASGQDASAVYESAYEAAGAKLVSKEFFERDRIDFVPLLTRVLAKEIDAFELDGNAPDTAGLLVKQLRELGFKGPIVSTGGDAVAEIVRIAGKAATENLYVHQPVDLALPAIKRYAQRYTGKYGMPMNGFSPFFYANLEMLFESMKRAGTVSDTDKIRGAMLSLKSFDTLVGKSSWMGQAKWGSNQQLSAPVYIGLVKNGSVGIVATCTPEKCE